MAFKKYQPGPSIKKVEFRDTWPNGRPYKHGAMAIFFKTNPRSVLAAEDEIEQYLASYDLIRSRDYHIPPWNFNRVSRYSINSNNITSPIIITFNDDETFVMTKLSWDCNENSD